MLRNLISGNLDFMQIIIYIISSLAVIFLTLPVHEFAHGLAAVKLGDNTPRWQGRLTLNPFAHIDYIGALCILLFGFGWAKPVQVNNFNFRNPKRDMALTAAAGPVSNLIMAFAGYLLFNLFYILTNSLGLVFLWYIGIFFLYVAQINISLAVFNLIPIPPLDGSRLLFAFLPDKYYYKLMQYERIIFWVLLLLLWTNILDLPLSFLSSAVQSGISFLAGLPFRLLGVL